MSYYYYRQFPHAGKVSCKTAQLLLDILFRGHGIFTGIIDLPTGARDLPQIFVERPNERMLDLRERLKRSGLAVMLAGGEGALPDITQNCDELSRIWFRLTRPRTYPQLAQHIARHLDWYLSPQRQQGRGPLAYAIWSGCGVLAGLLTGGALAIAGQGGIGVFIAALLCSGSALWGVAVALPNPQELMENNYELYNYLASAYCDPAEENAPTADGGVPQGELKTRDLEAGGGLADEHETPEPQSMLDEQFWRRLPH